MSGKLVSSAQYEANSNVYELNYDLKSGVYFVQLSNLETNQTKKLVVR